MLTINDLKPGVIFLYNNRPYRVLEASHLKKAQAAGMTQVKIKNLLSGAVISATFKSSDKFQEAEVSRVTGRFIYERRGQFWFSIKDTPWFDKLTTRSQRFSLAETEIGAAKNFLKPDLDLKIVFFEGRPIGIELPIKADFVVAEAPPGAKGNTAQGGTKTVTLETGAKIQAPLFIEAGDIIRINTQTNEYDQRVSAKKSL